MRGLLLLSPVLATCLLAQGAAAQTAMERIEPRLARAIEEHTIFLTCSSLDPKTYEGVLSTWRQMVGKARAYLQNRYTSLADLAAFDRRTAEETLVRKDAPLGEVIALCERHKDWTDRYYTFRITYEIDERPVAPY